MSVNFLHVLDEVGVETRRTQYNKSESSHFLYAINYNNSLKPMLDGI